MAVVKLPYVSLEDFEVGPRIGYGMCAKVYLVQRRLPSSVEQSNDNILEKSRTYRLALKLVHLTKRAYAEDVLTERHLLPQLSDCHFIVRLFAAFVVPDTPAACLVLSLGEGGDLFSLHEREYVDFTDFILFTLFFVMCIREVCEANFGDVKFSVLDDGLRRVVALHVYACEISETIFYFSTYCKLMFWQLLVYTVTKNMVCRGLFAAL